MSWDSKLESTIFTRLQYYLQKKYSTLNCTANDVTVAPSKFPTILIKQIESSPRYDLSHKEKTGFRHFMEIQVFAKTRTECKNIATLAEQYMEEWGYNTNGILINVGSQYATSIARYHRMVGGGDSDIVN